MFKKARIKLTLWYLLIIMVVSLSFSLVIYRVLNREVERFSRLQKFRIEKRLQNERIFPRSRPWENPPLRLSDPELIEETKRRILLTLVFVNGGIFLLAGTFGYFLAGRTLFPIKEMVQEQNQFIADASHQLRTPLTSLKSALEVALRDKKLTLSQAKTLMAENIAEVDRLKLLSDKLLQLTYYQPAKGKEVKPDFFSPEEIIEEAIEKMTPLARKKKVILKKEIFSSGFKIRGLKEALTEVIVIFLDNAVKYSPPGKTITLSLRKINNRVKIAVQDQGIGIKKEDLPYIFDRFYRGEKAREKEKVGYGLGLSIAKKIAELHRGEILVESQEGKGSLFTLSLPLSSVGFFRRSFFS